MGSSAGRQLFHVKRSVRCPVSGVRGSGEEGSWDSGSWESESPGVGEPGKLRSGDRGSGSPGARRSGDRGPRAGDPAVRSPSQTGRRRGDVQSLIRSSCVPVPMERTSRAGAKLKAELGGRLVESGQVVDTMAFLRDEVLYAPEALPRVTVSTLLDVVVVGAMMARAASGGVVSRPGLSAPRCASGFEASSLRRGRQDRRGRGTSPGHEQ